jgi:hypothetical protein
MKRKRKLPKDVWLKDLKPIFEKTIVSMCRESRHDRRFSPVEIDAIVRAAVSCFADTLEEYSVYIEQEDWDGLVALAQREQTRKMIRGLL